MLGMQVRMSVGTQVLCLSRHSLSFKDFSVLKDPFQSPFKVIR